MKNKVYIALVHHPVVNKEGRIVTTSVTNFDIHDLCRTACTYDVEKVFYITPSEAQNEMVTYIKSYWQEGFGASYNPDRKNALELAEVSKSLEQTCLTIEQHSGSFPLLVATTAKNTDKSVSYKFVREQIESVEQPILLIFGTGHGLAQSVLDQSQWILEPIQFAANYNHLSVRSAVAIILDRVLAIPYE